MLSKQTILDRTNSGFEIFRHYIQTKWQLGRNFLNPLYEDRKASCNIYFDRNSRTYKIKDFGNDEYSGDCFFFVGKLKGLDCNNGADFVEILKTIDRDLSLGLNVPDYNTQQPIPKSRQSLPEPQPQQNKPYNVIQQKFTQKESNFWLQSGITPEILKLYKTVSLKEFKSENKEGKPFSYTSSETEPLFGYIGFAESEQIIDFK